MTDERNVAERLGAGEEVEVCEIVGRMQELELHFDEQGFLYIDLNGWLIPSLDGSRNARELMCLRGVSECLNGLSDGAVVVVDREDDDAGDFLCEIGGRYVPDGYLYSVPSRSPEAEGGQAAGVRA